MSDPGKGVMAMIAASSIWGLSPLFFKLIDHIPVQEILAHRILWSALIFLLLLGLQGRVGQLFAILLRPREMLVILFAALMISLNWLTFLTSIQIGHAVEASFGYFMFPLVSVLLGRVVFAERLSRMQAVSVALAASAVVLLALGLGVAPWIALVISISFGLYGVAKKKISAGPVLSVTGEVVLLAPLAAAMLVYLHRGGTGAFGGGMADSLLLAFSGVLTATPLILFSYATKRVRMGTIGLVQYLNPSLQFFCAVVVFAEPFGRWHAISFGMIWVALFIYTLAGWQSARAASRISRAASTVAAGVTNSNRSASAKP